MPPAKSACYDSRVPFDQNFVRTLEALRILARKIRSGENRGDRTSSRKGSSIEFSGHRAYTPGDEIRYIDWNIPVLDPDGDPEETVLEAAENCPVSAITVKDAETGEQLFP